MPRINATRAEHAAKVAKARRRLAESPTNFDALRASIISNSRAAQIARTLAAQKMGLVNDPTGANLPDDLWQQCLPEARAILAAPR